MQHLGIDGHPGALSGCVIDEAGEQREGAMPADQRGLGRIAPTPGSDAGVYECIELRSGVVWVRDQLAAGGWGIRLADAAR